MTPSPGALAVDVGARTITDIAVPYGRTAVMSNRAFRFLPGWARYGRVPLLLDHDRSQRLGRAVQITDTPAGLAVVLFVKRGPRGDWALAEVDAGRLGLSPGVALDPALLEPDPDDPPVRLVADAELTEITLTARTAFGKG